MCKNISIRDKYLEVLIEAIKLTNSKNKRKKLTNRINKMVKTYYSNDVEIRSIIDALKNDQEYKNAHLHNLLKQLRRKLNKVSKKLDAKM